MKKTIYVNAKLINEIELQQIRSFINWNELTKEQFKFLDNLLTIKVGK